ncbi:hypothetical protein V500_05871 [Pseudogymnoascus sp. VKM F-4518 (FW-2643)]|nr:hypothetical protein V500_05871 [Pseudogymnoascus sp. VKM F-4518 (FW-2643)]
MSPHRRKEAPAKNHSFQPEYPNNAIFSVVICGGHVHYHVMGTETYTGYLPEATPDFTADAPSIVRRVGSDGPVELLTGDEMACNFNAVPILDGDVSRVGAVTAGTNITFDWGGGFPHSGPILTYMAKCEPDCGHFTGNEGDVWFKIDEAAYGTMWATQTLFDQDNKWYSKVPECLAPGEYLVRHEIIALSGCASENKCQFYPSCAQVKVEGDGTVVPSTDLIAFPGGYKFADVKWDSNTQAPIDYVLPGAPVFQCPS